MTKILKLRKILHFIYHFQPRIIVSRIFFWRRLSGRRKQVFWIGVLSLILFFSPFVYDSLTNVGKAEAEWFDLRWQYRAAIPISTHTSAENNVYIAVTIDTSGSGKFQSDCGDLRFTKQNGTILPYYIVSGCTTATTVAHVNFDSFPAGAQTIYYYYGNPSAPNGFSNADFSTEASNYTIGTVGSEEVGAGPVAYWKFDEGQGTVANDSTTNNNDGTVSGATWQTEDQCITGKCLYFDGTDDRVQKTSPVAIPGDSYTMSAWINPKSTTNNGVFIGMGDHSVADQIFYINTSSKLDCTSYRAGGSDDCTDGSTTLTANTWYYVAITRTTSQILIYLNGKLDSTTSTGASAANYGTTATMDIGSRGTVASRYFKGFIDDSKIYPYARTAAQVKSDLASRGSVRGTSASIGSSDPATSLSNGLVGYWKMDESSGAGSTLADSSGNGNNGTAVLWGGGNTATDSAHVSGKFGNGFSFDGEDDYVVATPSKTGRNFATIAGWVNFDDSDNVNLVDKYHSFFGWQYDLNLIFRTYTSEPGAGYFFRLDGTTANGGTNNLNKTYSIPSKLSGWHHLTATYDGTNATIYFDGIPVSSQALVDTGLKDLGRTFHIGNESDGGSNWDGKIDEVRAYSRALSPAEVQQLYNFAPGPITYWKFDEKSGSTTNDSSSNSIGATLFNSPLWINGKFGGALQYDGTSSYTRSTTNSFSSLGTSNLPYTIDGWVKIGSGVTQGNVVHVAQASDGTGWCLPLVAISGSKLVANSWKGTLSTATGTSTLSANTWYHFATTWDPVNGLRIFVNGNLESSVAQTIYTASGVSDYVFVGKDGSGCSNNKGLLNGTVDDVHIYNYARTPGQIISDMNAGHPLGGSPVGSQIGYWRFDEGYGSTAHNSGSQGTTLDGTLTPGATGGNTTAAQMWSLSGKFSKAIEFDGTNDYVDLGDVNSVDGISTLTACSWATTSSLINYESVWGKALSGDGNNRIGMGLGSASEGGNNDVLIFMGNGSDTEGYTTSNAINPNVWNHWCMVFDGTQTGNSNRLKFYLNGTQLTLTYIGTIPATTPSNAYTMVIGAHHTTGSFWAGTIDDFKIYNAALTSDEIKIDYNRGKSLVLGTSGTSSDGITASSSAERAYCPPGDTTASCAPVGEWNFNEAQGGTVNDSSGNGNTGTWNGTGSHWTRGKYGKAGNFNGSNDYVSAGSNPITGSSAFSMSTWLKAGTHSNYGLAYFIGTAASGQAAYLGWVTTAQSGTSNSLGGGFYGTNYGSGITDSNWHYVTLTFAGGAGGAVKLYVDGVVKVSTTATPNLSSTSISFGKANSGTQYWYNGQVDQARLYNYTLSSAQVAWNYNQGGPVAHWRLDECEGAIAHDAAFDAARGGNNGTITIGGTGTQTAVGTCSTASTAWGNGITGKRNASLNFDGTDDSVSMGDPASGVLDFGSNDFTYSLWIKSGSAASEADLIAKRVGSIDVSLSYNTANKIRFQVYNSSYQVDLISTNTVALNEWHLITAVRSGTAQYIYIDGRLDNSGTGTVKDISSSASFTLGRNPIVANRFYTGQLDDVRVYNYALTPVQIKTLMNDGAVRWGPVTGSP